MRVAGIDLSTRHIDIVLVDQDTGRIDWHRWPLGDGPDAFDRTRNIPLAMPARTSELWDDVIGIGIEQPAGHHGVLPLIRVQGAILACLPTGTLVHPYTPARWKHLNGIGGNATKDDVARASKAHIVRWCAGHPMTLEQAARYDRWPQDAHDAHLIARAMLTDLATQGKAAPALA